MRLRKFSRAARAWLAAALLAGSPAAAAPEPDREEARKILRRAVAFHREARDLTLVFQAESYSAALDKTEKYRGKLILKDSLRFRLEIPSATYVSDGSTLWEYRPKNRQVVIRAAGEMGEQSPPGQALLRFLDAEPQGLSRVKSAGREYLELRLDPRRAVKNLDSLAVWLKPADFSLHRVASRDVSGNETRYTIVSAKRNAGVKDATFRFAPPKGTEVVDMRE